MIFKRQVSWLAGRHHPPAFPEGSMAGPLQWRLWRDGSPHTVAGAAAALDRFIGPHRILS